MCSQNSVCYDLDPDEGGLPYECRCIPGYDGNGVVCCEIDECSLGLDLCSGNATCLNTEGSYECSCLPGYDGDGFTCEIICPDKQILGPNGIDCICDEGYVQNFTALPELVCYDIDECDLNIDYACDQFGVCNNIVGNYTCMGCIPPYIGSGYKGDCCLNLCPFREECRDNECQCKPGYYREADGKCYRECHDRCALPDTNEQCLEGDCICRWGYQRNNEGLCEPIPCMCHEHADCFDVIIDPATGRTEKQCICKSGLQGDGRDSCVDINECEGDTGICGEAACCNLFGGFICVCDCGMEFEFTNKTCHDIDECALGTHACLADQICYNEFAHHSCSCDPEECGVLMGQRRFPMHLPCFKPEPYTP